MIYYQKEGLKTMSDKSPKPPHIHLQPYATIANGSLTNLETSAYIRLFFINSL